MIKFNKANVDGLKSSEKYLAALQKTAEQMLAQRGRAVRCEGYLNGWAIAIEIKKSGLTASGAVRWRKEWYFGSKRVSKEQALKTLKQFEA